MVYTGEPSGIMETLLVTQPASARRVSVLASVLAVSFATQSVLRAQDREPASAVSQAPAARKPTVDAAAEQAAAAVQAFYDQTRDVSATFFQTYVNKLYGRTDRSQGRVVFKKPGKMRWDYDKPNGKVIVAGSGRLLIYEPGEERGDNGQVLEQAFSDADLPQAMAFLLGTGKLQDDFTFRLLDATKEGYPSGQVLELTPQRPNPHFERLLFYVESTPAVRGLVRRLLIVDVNGNRNRFDFSGFKFNSGVSESAFNWKPPASARRVQL